MEYLYEKTTFHEQVVTPAQVCEQGNSINSSLLNKEIQQQFKRFNIFPNSVVVKETYFYVFIYFGDGSRIDIPKSK